MNDVDASTPPAGGSEDALERLIRAALPGAGPAGSFTFFRRGEDGARPEPAPGLAAGKVVGDFRLVALLGQGGMGQVWEAEQLSLRRRVAVKFVRPERVTTHQLELFAREARAGGRLSHPGIVAVFGHGHSDGLDWIALELVGGAWSLRDFLDEAARAPEVPEGYDRHVARFVAEIADAMQTAHAAGVIHRDLKPQNVLITPEEHPKVTDFGLARIMDETALSVTGDFAGTYLYMSPEQVAAKRAGIDHRTDIFSLGAVLYELLALRRPFEGDTTHQIAAQILAKDPPDIRTIRSRVPRDLAVIASKALEKDPDRRFQAMAEFAADLRRHLGNEPIHARPPTALERVTKWCRRHPTKSAAAAVAGVTFTVIALLLAQNVRTNRELVRQTAEAERLAESERKAAEEARSRAEQVFRLSAQKDLDDLIARADRLWPMRPEDAPRYREWLAEAERQLRALPEHENQLASLTRRGRALTSEERDLARAENARQRELEGLEGELRYRRGLLEGIEGRPRERSSDAPEGSRDDWLSRAWSLVHPRRSIFGREAEGLACAQAALAAAGDEDPRTRAELGMLVAWGLYGLGHFDEAMLHAEGALAEIESDPGAIGKDLEGLRAELERLMTPEGQEQETWRIAQLEERRVALEAEVAASVPAVAHDDAGERWWFAQTALLVEGLQALADVDTGLVRGLSAEHGWGVERRLLFVDSLVEQTLEGPAPRALWEQARASIGDERECPAYGGLRIRPQLGLLPLGRDPDSGLWEFAHLMSGEPARRGSDGRLVVEERTGIVLVLVPGGSFWMGAQNTNPGGFHYDPAALPDEAPVHELTLAPFFVSKFEMTQAQWIRLAGENPSTYNPEFKLEGKPPIIDLRHPVEDLSWTECERMARWLGLDLPTEAQWEYAARGGTDSVWSTGDARESLQGHTNLFDLYCKNNGGPTGDVYDEWLDDGSAFHAPVGAYRSNLFGLHDIHGNVAEWCREHYVDFGYSAYAGDAARLAPPGAESRMYRGGGFTHKAAEARSALRTFASPDTRQFFLGLRPSVRLQ